VHPGTPGWSLPIGLISDLSHEEQREFFTGRAEDEKDCGEISLESKVFSPSFLL
jgi:hypothetical protein